MSSRGGGGRGEGDRGRGGRGGGDGYGGGQRGGASDRGGGFDRGGRSNRGGGFERDGGGQGGYARGGGDRGGRGGMDVQVFRQSNIQPRVDPTVTRAEDAKVASNARVLDLRKGHPPRPGFGTKGAPVLLWANYVRIVPNIDLALYRYSISSTPEAKGKKLGRVVQLALEATELAAYRDDLVTDFRSTLISQKRLSGDDLVVPVVYRGDQEDTPREEATTYSVRIQYTHSLPVSELVQYLTSTSSAVFSLTPEFVQAFNIFLNHYAKSRDNQAQIGSSKSFSLDRDADRTRLGSGLEAIRGFFSSVRLATGRILVNVNVSHAAFYEAGPLPDVVDAYARSHNFDRACLNRFVAKLAVRTTHLPRRFNSAGHEIHRVKRIAGLATPRDGEDLPRRPLVKAFGAGAADVQFWLEERPSAGSPSKASKSKSKGKKGQHEDGSGPSTSTAPSPGRYITVAEYFRTTYQMQLKHPQAPVINTGTRQNPVYLPPEVCFVPQGQNANARLDPQQTQEMIKFAVRKPWLNATSIVDQGLRMAGLDPATNAMLERFGIRVDGHLISVPGRVLDSPRIQYSGNKALNTQFGSWNLRDVAFSRAGSIAAWSGVYISMGRTRTPFSGDEVNRLMSILHGNLQKVGIRAPAPLAANPLIIEDEDDQQLDGLMQRAATRFSVLFVILPATSSALYNRIKYLGDVKHGIQTICSIGTTLAKQRDQRLDQYFANIALKFNLKMGGVNHHLDTTRMPLMAEGKTMLVGIDVTHPSPGSASNAPSVAGMVGSVDRLLGQFPAALSVQPSRQEWVGDLRGMLISRLILWRKRSGSAPALPENIIVYRDGVSEGQYDKVLEAELPQLRAAAAELYPAPAQKSGLPRITIIIVGKRHHTRFYPTAEREADRSGNTRPGTVVDRGVTRADEWDFFLQPHAALQGTARPAHYYVVLDEVFRRRYARPQPGGAFQNVEDVVEEFTHSLCYLFGRATKAVSLCPPAYYADIVCERARCYLSRVFDTPEPSVMSGSAGGGDVSQDDVKIHDRLRDTMFYI